MALGVCYVLAVLFSGIFDAMGREGRMGLVAALWIVMDSVILWAYYQTKIKKSPECSVRNP